MSFFPPDMPRPFPQFDDAGFWKHCALQQLRFQVCADCNTPRHPPTPVCPCCHSFNVDWKATQGHGTVYTYTIIHHASHEAVKPNLPYAVGVIEFADVPGVRLVSNITNIDPAQVRIGMPVHLWWDDIGEGMWIPRFSP